MKLLCRLSNLVNAETEQYYDSCNPHLQETERVWRESVSRSVQSFKNEIAHQNPDFVKEARIEYLEGEIFKEEIMADFGVEIVKSVSWVKESEDRINRYKSQIRFLKQNFRAPAQEHDIEKARSHQFSEFIEIGHNGMMKCPWHKGGQESQASMKVYGNNAHCFTCGKSYDIIDLVRLLHSCSFKEALKMLNG